MLGTSIHASGMATPAQASRKTMRSAALIGALLLAAVAVNLFIALADIRARAMSLAGTGSVVVCTSGNGTHLAQHPFRGALAPYKTCTAPHG